MERVHPVMSLLYLWLLLEVMAQGNCLRFPPEYPGYVSLMIMYNTYFSIVMVAVSVVAPNKASEAEEEQESSDYKCALCEQFKDNPNP